jgi:hypothetical protein
MISIRGTELGLEEYEKSDVLSQCLNQSFSSPSCTANPPMLKEI